MTDQTEPKDPHMPMLALCADCERIVQLAVEQLPPLDKFMPFPKWCEAHMTFAIAFYRQGAIRSWHINGPMQKIEGEQRALEVLARIEQMAVDEVRPPDSSLQ